MHKTNVWLLLLVFLSAGALGYYLTQISSDDIASYHELMSKIAKETAGDSQSSSQHRKVGEKDLYYQKDGSRIHLNVKSLHSEILWVYDGDDKRMVEKMADMDAVIVDGDATHYIKAREGVFDYKNQILNATKVKLDQYKNHERVLQLIADTMHSSFKDECCIEAESFRGSIDKFRIQGDHLESNGLLTYLSGHLIMQSEKGKAKADHAFLKSTERYAAPIHVQLMDAVTINTDDGLQLDCVKADFDLAKMSGVFKGIAGAPAVFKSGNITQGTIKGREMQVDTLDGRVDVLRVYGNVEGQLENQFSVTSHYAEYHAPNKENEDYLVFQEKVHFDHPTLSQLDVDSFARVDWNKDALGKKQIKLIQTTGHTHLKILDERGGFRIVEGDGPVTIDYAAKTAVMEKSPVKGKQILIKDSLGKIFADKFKATFKEQDQKLLFSEIHLDGHVKMHNGLSDSKVNGLLDQYIISDHAVYSPQTKAVYLEARKGKRVLLYDRVNNLKISAGAMKLQRDVNTQKDEIQGIGDVRFTLVEREQKEIAKFLNQLQGASKK